MAEANSEPEAHAALGPDPLQGYNLTHEQHELLEGLLKEEAKAADGDLLSVAAALTLFEVSVTLRQPTALVESAAADSGGGGGGECSGEGSGEGSSSSSSSSSDSTRLWVSCAMQMVKFDVSMLNGAIGALLTCEQIRVTDRAPGAAYATRGRNPRSAQPTGLCASLTREPRCGQAGVCQRARQARGALCRRRGRHRRTL